MINKDMPIYDMVNQLFEEDCLECMKRIPDASIDMVLCNLPYGMTQKRNSHATFTQLTRNFSNGTVFDNLSNEYKNIHEENSLSSDITLKSNLLDLRQRLTNGRSESA